MGRVRTAALCHPASRGARGTRCGTRRFARARAGAVRGVLWRAVAGGVAVALTFSKSKDAPSSSRSAFAAKITGAAVHMGGRAGRAVTRPRTGHTKYILIRPIRAAFAFRLKVPDQCGEQSPVGRPGPRDVGRGWL